MEHFVKYNDWWWEYDPTQPKNNTTLYNEMGGKNSNIDITGLETIEANSLSELNWKGTAALDNHYKTGWLSPEGVFYGCDYRNHAFQAKYIHNKDEQEIADLGWVKISYLSGYHTNKKILVAYFYSSNKTIYPTMEQYEYIKNHYDGKDKEEMAGYLSYVRMQRRNEIKKDWENEK